MAAQTDPTWAAIHDPSTGGGYRRPARECHDVAGRRTLAASGRCGPWTQDMSRARMGSSSRAPAHAAGATVSLSKS
jgi:hypothetical protein